MDSFSVNDLKRLLKIHGSKIGVTLCPYCIQYQLRLNLIALFILKAESQYRISKATMEQTVSKLGSFSTQQPYTMPAASFVQPNNDQTPSIDFQPNFPDPKRILNPGTSPLFSPFAGDSRVLLK